MQKTFAGHLLSAAGAALACRAVRARTRGAIVA
jgi:hypothetical protein